MKITAQHRVLATQELQRLLLQSEEILGAVVASRDGRPFVHALRASVDQGRFAAMASSLVALGTSILKELQAGTLNHLLIQADMGQIILTRVPDSGGLLILALLASSNARLGLMLSHAKSSGAELSRIVLANGD